MSQQQHDFKEGDRVLYRPVGGAMQTSVGVIKKILTHPEEVGSRHTEVKASEEMPRYVQFTCDHALNLIHFMSCIGH